jgi:hypothetical protein
MKDIPGTGILNFDEIDLASAQAKTKCFSKED